MNSIPAFVHIEKTGGTSLIWTLRRDFPFSHCDIIPGGNSSNHISETDIQTAYRAYPKLRSIAGHSIRPWIDFGKYREQLKLYTILRPGTDRYISEYYHDSVKRGFSDGIEQWIRYEEKWNFQTRAVAGRVDLDAAKEALVNDFEIVGLLENYEEFILNVQTLFYPDCFGSSFEHLNKRGLPSGKLRGDSQTVEPISDKTRRRCDELNALDNELYEFAKTEVLPRQRERLAALVGSEKFETASSRQRALPRLRQQAYRAYRNAVYKPMCGVVPFRTHAILSNSRNVKAKRIHDGLELPPNSQSLETANAGESDS